MTKTETIYVAMTQDDDDEVHLVGAYRSHDSAVRGLVDFFEPMFEDLISDRSKRPTTLEVNAAQDWRCTIEATDLEG